MEEHEEDTIRANRSTSSSDNNSITVVNPYANKRKHADTAETKHVLQASSAKVAVAATGRKRPAVNVHTSSSTASALVIAAADKAGMQGIDRARIDAIILRESEKTQYMQQQRERDEKVNQRIVALREKLKDAEWNNPQWKLTIEAELNMQQHAIIAKRPSRSTSVVVDMDMFYMACELLSKPHLRNVPACVGHSMITTSNYTARKYGVRSAMAGWIADKLVEELSNGTERLHHVPNNFALYKETSAIVKQVLCEYDPHLRSHSLDEAFMDIGPYLAAKLLHADWDHDKIANSLKESERVNQNAQSVLQSFSMSDCMQVADTILHAMRQHVCKATGGLTCSAGLAPNFMLAKIASDKNKPDGQCLIGSTQEQVEQFLYPCTLRKVGGIGRVTEKILQAFGLKTVRDLYKERALVKLLFNPATAVFLWRTSLGCQSSHDVDCSDAQDSNDSTTTTDHQKGNGRERTFTANSSLTFLQAKLEDIAHLVSHDMQKKNLMARTITLRLKLSTFHVISRSRTLPVFIQSADELLVQALQLLYQVRSEMAISARLIGIRCSSLEERTSKPASIQDCWSKVTKSNNDDDAVVVVDSREMLRDAVKQSETHREPGMKQLKLDATTTTRATNHIKPKDDSDDSPDVPSVNCPVCGMEVSISCKGQTIETAVNQHLDACLQQQGNMQVSISDHIPGSKSVDKTRKKIRPITDFWKVQ